MLKENENSILKIGNFFLDLNENIIILKNNEV